MMMMIMIPIVVTLVGIVTAVSDVHPAKAFEPKNMIRVSNVDNVYNVVTINTNSSNTSRNSNRYQIDTSPKCIIT